MGSRQCYWQDMGVADCAMFRSCFKVLRLASGCRGQMLDSMSEYEVEHLLQQSLADTPKQPSGAAGGDAVPAPNALRGTSTAWMCLCP